MIDELKLYRIATVKSDFGGKFGIPRQSGLAGSLESEIIMEKQFSVEDAFRGIEGYSYLWIIWGFSLNERREDGKGFNATVRPPKLGGNERTGVFATRSPFRPNPIGLSLVRFISIRKDNGVLKLTVEGGDMADGTPVYDIKPYLPLYESKEDALGGFSDSSFVKLKAVIPDKLLALIPPEKREGLITALAEDPRPAYQNDENRVYAMTFCGFDVKFSVKDGFVTVTDVLTREDK